MIRRLGALWLFALVVALLGSVAVSVTAARQALEMQLGRHSQDDAALLAVALSLQAGHRDEMAKLAADQFDRGMYGRVQLIGADGGVWFERSAPAHPQTAPAWFARWVTLDPSPGAAQLSEGWRALGVVTIEQPMGAAYDAMWAGALHTLALLGSLGMLAGWAGLCVVRGLRDPLDAAVRQAQALLDGRFVSVPEPKAREFATLTAAMNTLVARLQHLFAAQALQVETLRRQALCDPLTGLADRAHFLAQLDAVLAREDGPACGGLVLLRLADPTKLNRVLGHEATDQILLAIAEALSAYPHRVDSCFAGRLNGADFALCMPVSQMAAETAMALADALRATLPAFGREVHVSLGSVEFTHGTDAGQLLGAADAALAAAESRGPYVAEHAVPGTTAFVPLGEEAWREGLRHALDYHEVALVAYELRGRDHRLLHLECPLRLRLQREGALEPAARWLPLALRLGMTPAIDRRAVQLALAAIGDDGLPRCVNLAGASLMDRAFVAELQSMLEADPRSATALSIDVAERVAVDAFETLRDLCARLRPLGVRIGLEHAGPMLSQIERLYEAGLDYLKLDESVTRGAATYPRVATYVAHTVALAHTLALPVYVEGVVDSDVAQALWDCGVDGITGPFVDAVIGLRAA